MKKLRYILNGKQKIIFVLFAMLNIVGALMETIAVYMMLPFVSSVMGSEDEYNSGVLKCINDLFDCHSDQQLLMTMAIIISVIYVFKSIYLFTVNYAQQRYFAKQRIDISRKIYACILEKPYSYHLHSSTAVTQRLVSSDIDKLFELINYVMSIISEGFTGLFLLLVLMLTDTELTLMAVGAILIIIILINKIVTPNIRKVGQESMSAFTEMMKSVYQTVGGLKGILVNHKENSFLQQYTQNTQKYAMTNSLYLILVDLPRRTIEAVSMGGIFTAMAVIIATGEDLGKMLPIFATFALAAVRLIPVANRMNAAVNQITFNTVSMDAIYNLLVESKANMNEVVKLDAEDSTIREVSLREGIRLENISFHYSDSDKFLYKNLSLEIPAGKSVAFIGETGSGKTTLADIILGLHAIQEGEIYVDGHNIYEEKEWWAKQIGYIPQNVFLCDSSIRENIAFGIAPQKIDDERVWQCIKEAQLSEFVKTLPEGLDTITGENGIRLSGGQKQRIGIARALYEDPPFLVMDEATSALDNDTEQAIIDMINEFVGRKTLLIIAHRLSTIKNCDIVYRIENGEAMRER